MSSHHLHAAAAGLRAVIIKLFPKSVLMAGAAGIGVFIAFVGMKVRPADTQFGCIVCCLRGCHAVQRHSMRASDICSVVWQQLLLLLVHHALLLLNDCCTYTQCKSTACCSAVLACCRMPGLLLLHPSLPWWGSTQSGRTSTVRAGLAQAIGCKQWLQLDTWDVCALAAVCIAADASVLVLMPALHHGSFLQASGDKTARQPSWYCFCCSTKYPGKCCAECVWNVRVIECADAV
jgi:hypothetical protein